MKKLLFASVAALGLAAVPALAQAQADAPLGSTNSVADKRPALTPEQQAIYDTISPDYRTQFDTWESNRQVMYFGWDDALRGFFWQLDADQQEVWWDLTRDQQISLFQRDISWASVMDSPQATRPAFELARNSAPTNMQAATQTASISFRSSPVIQPAESTRTTEYPVCRSDADDSCINAWAAGQRGPGVTRPLDYYPEAETSRGG